MTVTPKPGGCVNVNVAKPHLNKIQKLMVILIKLNLIALSELYMNIITLKLL